VETSCQFYIAGDQLGFSTFDSLLLYLSFVSRLDLTRGSPSWSSRMRASMREREKERFATTCARSRKIKYQSCSPNERFINKSSTCRCPRRLENMIAQATWFPCVQDVLGFGGLIGSSMSDDDIVAGLYG
jgi:hypothetical protein